MNFLQRYLKNNTFMYRAGNITSLYGEDQNNGNQIDKSIFPILIIAREHYQQYTKSYPVSDKRDVKNIIENEFSGLKMFDIQSENLTSFSANIFVFDESSESYVRNRMCIYIPETLLARFLTEGELTTVNRLGATLNYIKKANTVFSSSGEGLYQNPELFLISSGAGEAESRTTLDQQTYFDLLYRQLLNIKTANLPFVLSGQVVHKRALKSLHLPSIASGIAVSIVVYWIVLFGTLKWQETFVESEVSSAQVRAVMDARQSLNEKVARIEELSRGIESKVSGKVLWSIVSLLLESGVSVSSFVYENREIKLRVLAPSAADAVKLLRQMPEINAVVMEGEISVFHGKQNAKLLIELNREASSV